MNGTNKWFGVLLIVVSLLVSATSCRTHRCTVVEKDTVRVVTSDYDSAYWWRVLTDSSYYRTLQRNDTYVTDSVYIIEKADGSRDTYRTHSEVSSSQQTDTVYQYIRDTKEEGRLKERIDSLTKIKNKVEYVEKELGLTDRLFLTFGKFALVLIIILGISYIVKRKYSH